MFGFKKRFMSIVSLYILLNSLLQCTWAITIYVPPPTSANCRDMTPFADQQDCTSYYQCFRTGPTWTLIHSMCPTGGFWNDEYKACVEGKCGADMTTTTKKAPTTKPPVKPPPPPPPPPPPKLTTTTKNPVVTKPTSRPTGKPIFLCTHNGIFAHPTDHKKYYTCIRLGRHFYYYVYSCPPFTCFQASSKHCTTSC